MQTHSLALICALAAFPAAGAPSFSLPVDCELGETCFIQNYVDHDDSDGHLDHTCGPLSYDGHKGTDFALPTTDAMDAGVNVLAAADGVVLGTRDGMVDKVIAVENIPKLNGKDCGNGVSIDHGGGWVSQYCHMKQDSVAVAQGDEIAAGQVLGQIGLSGRTQFPHLHISIREGNRVVDPFAPEQLGVCGDAQDTLWDNGIDYVGGGLIRIGFEVGLPKFASIKSGMAGRSRVPSQAKALVLFGYAFGSLPDDEMTLTITGPQGTVFDQSVTLEKTQAQYFRAGGKRTPMGGWPKGTYHGAVTITRDGAQLDHQTISLTVE
ncbi:M23 family metallopeptidase [Shimia sagamensis]|uniref:Peptidase family M23 n=1 Tax=Shimia sagamensis TaxID=1566352 RepID=A0ABY1P4Z0_9RHOB|nr:M23 family metallopeptidase [Shimia sagamensis]SMP26665.1 Peptidase family M23 [Shimia sagamensis]